MSNIEKKCLASPGIRMWLASIGRPELRPENNDFWECEFERIKGERAENGYELFQCVRPECRAIAVKHSKPKQIFWRETMDGCIETFDNNYPWSEHNLHLTMDSAKRFHQAKEQP